jgi:hypothetical protein
MDEYQHKNICVSVADKCDPNPNHVGVLPTVLASLPPPPEFLKINDEAVSMMRTLSSYYLFTNTYRPLLVRRISKDQNIFECADAIGTKFYYKLILSRFSKKPSLRKIRGDEKVLIRFENWEPLRNARVQGFVLPIDGVDALAKSIARSQAKASSTLNGQPDAKLVAANKYMLQKITSSEGLNEVDLETINLLASYQNGHLKLKNVDGVMRGDFRTFFVGDRSVSIDNSGLEISHGEVLAYLPSKDVKSAVRQWLFKANEVGENTSLLEIAELVQLLIAIHPFPEGNGRTVKIILDYLLLQAGMSPMPHDPYLTKNFLFITSSDLELNFRKAYKEAGMLH